MKIGDKVQFLSDIGGGRIAGFQGKDIALVEDEDGFQIPTPVTDLVVMSSSDDYSISKSIQKKSGAELADGSWSRYVQHVGEGEDKPDGRRRAGG